MGDGKCILPSQFLSAYNIEYFNDQLEKHFSTMSRAFYISRVFKSFSNPLDSLNNENSLHSQSNSPSKLPPKDSESQSVTVQLDIHSTFLDTKTSSTSAFNDVHTQSNTYDFQVDTLTSEDSLSTVYSIDDNILNPNSHLSYIDSKSKFDNNGDPPGCEILNFQKPVSPASSNLSTQNNIKVISKDKFQLLIQNWMQIRICRFSDFFCSIYNDALKHNFGNPSYPVEYSTQVSSILNYYQF